MDRDQDREIKEVKRSNRFWIVLFAGLTIIFLLLLFTPAFRDNNNQQQRETPAPSKPQVEPDNKDGGGQDQKPY